MTARIVPCEDCYETDDLGQITFYLCSRFGWASRHASPCHCAHHETEVPLVDLLMFKRAAA